MLNLLVLWILLSLSLGGLMYWGKRQGYHRRSVSDALEEHLPLVTVYAGLGLFWLGFTLLLLFRWL